MPNAGIESFPVLPPYLADSGGDKGFLIVVKLCTLRYCVVSET